MLDQGNTTGKVPETVRLEAGKRYAWCACGQSENQPWCNGAHKGSKLAPKVFQAEVSKTVAICTCKQTSKPPYCDGSHARLV